MLVMLGQNVYQDDFQRHFLKESSEFYKVSQAMCNLDLIINLDRLFKFLNTER